MTDFEPRTFGIGSDRSAKWATTNAHKFVIKFTYLKNFPILWTLYGHQLHRTQCDQMGDFLHFGQLFQAFGNNKFAQISHILRQFL